MKRKSAKAKAEALRLHDSGVSSAQISRQLKKRFREDVSIACIRRWVALRNTAQSEQAVDDITRQYLDPEAKYDVRVIDDEVQLDPVAPEPELDTVSEFERMAREATRLAKLAEREGNMTAAGKFMRDALKAQEALARLRAGQRKSEAGVFIPQADVDRNMNQIRDTFTALLTDLQRCGGLVCSQCGRDIRLDLAKGNQ